MGEKTGIAWTDHTFNPWHGCVAVSEACKHCYAEVATPIRVKRARGLELWGPASTTARDRTSVANWNDVRRWDRAARAAGRRARVFCASLADVFEAHPMLPPWRADLWRVIEECDGLDWQLLTKRPQNIRAMVPPSWLESWPAHVWVGCTVENAARAAERIPLLLDVPARVRFLSCEPLAEALDLGPWLARAPVVGVPASRGLQWVIVGGESGSRARPFDVAWARAIVARCKAAGVACFVKQMGDQPFTTADDAATWPSRVEFSHYIDPKLHPDRRFPVLGHHGADPSGWPADLRVQEFPEVRS